MHRLDPSRTESCLIEQQFTNTSVDNTITVYGGTNYITIDNLNIKHSGTVIDIEDNANVYLTLKGTNTISDDFAGATTAFIVSSGSTLHINNSFTNSADSLNIIARNGHGTGIGGGFGPGKGGTVTNSSPIMSSDSPKSTITFSGGSIHSSTDNVPKDTNGNNLTLSTISLPDYLQNQGINFINITQDGNSYNYGSGDVCTDSNGKLYLWLSLAQMVQT